MNIIVKIIGMLFIMFSGTAIGFYRSYTYIKRVEQRKKVHSGMENLKQKINFGADELPEILSDSFKDCGAVRVNGSRAKAVEYGINGEDKRIINEFFLSLGSAVGKRECERIEMYMDLMSNRINSAQKIVNEKSKLWRTFGFCGALALCIMII